MSKQDILRLVMEGFGASEEYTTAEIIYRISKLLTPIEPTGYAALVEDVQGCLWVGIGGSHWSMIGSDLACSWQSLNTDEGPVNILFRGVERP